MKPEAKARIANAHATNIDRLANALSEAGSALAGLEFDDRRRVLRWVCDYYLIDPSKIAVGS